MTQIELTAKQSADFQKHMKGLNKLRKDVEKANKGAKISWYFESGGGLNLIEGESHDSNGSPNYENVIDKEYLDNSNCGGW